MSRDILQLKLEKALLKEQLKANDAKSAKLSQILLKKSQTKKHLQPIDERTMTLKGCCLADIRVPMRSVKSLANINKPRSDVEPLAVENEDILRIRQDHAIKHKGQSEVNKKIKEKELKEKRIQERNKPKKYPVIRVPASMLPNRYIRGELPCTIEHGISGHYLSWACPLENLDYEYYLPIFFDGLQCREHPACFLARQGIEDMLIAARGNPDRIIPCIKNLVRPLRNAFSKYDTFLVLGALKAIQQLVYCHPSIGQALLPYSKQFMGPISTFMNENRNIGDSIDYGQRKHDDTGEEIRKTLELLEETGGSNALALIKFSIPVYESCLKRPDAHHHHLATAAKTTSGKKS